MKRIGITIPEPADLTDRKAAKLWKEYKECREALKTVRKLLIRYVDFRKSIQLIGKGFLELRSARAYKLSPEYTFRMIEHKHGGDVAISCIGQITQSDIKLALGKERGGRMIKALKEAGALHLHSERIDLKELAKQTKKPLSFG